MDNPRVALAKDVLAHLDSLKNVNGGTYCYLPRQYFRDMPREGEVRPYLDKMDRCEVCALGSMFLSYIRLFDKVSFENHMSLHEENFHARKNQILPFLQEVGFSEYELNTIESAFEYCHMFYTSTRNYKDRLRLIMQNIIDNDGTFVYHPHMQYQD